MNAQKIIFRIFSVAVCALMGYLLYEMMREVLSSPDGIVIQGWIAIFITFLLLLLLVPLAYSSWKCNRNGTVSILLFIGGIIIFGLVTKLGSLVSVQLRDTPSTLRLLSSILFLIAPFMLPVIFYRWGKQKLLAEQGAVANPVIRRL